ncbi:type II toxin-antitoxin system PemK/MazF family toxin [Pseudanabaena galeata UHCC 0370]|uniref:Type II toxin-antitoxin system PemK/MazF family toxin n=1 Tax=Pseudanabaena galeata UHCC 0370 TaxID=3110310 RepID=A0ABU5TJH7_9CYAN|nr:type II toxin-antitoxin system PemK/MazF family toxin [Pseudanabaena galeata]MEA5478477.1 type II toxin-antitoxin system PemK/MazF family toxin [Pseudanabaena galeata UHCC 0370]
MSNYIPQKGDFIIITFDPQSGHEQKGRRPALVVSNSVFNQYTGLAIVCPITNTYRDSSFHVAIANSQILTGYVMVEQVKSIDYKSRKVKWIETAANDLLAEVLSILDACIY